MGKSTKNIALVLLFAAAVVGSAAQTTYQVLDSLGWSIPTGGSAAYTTWAANKSFTVGDTLVFNYTTGQHDVAEVTKAAYDSCSATSPISIQTTGPTSIQLASAGEHYYICTFTSHCTIGQKLAINVSTASGSAPAPAPTSGSPAAPTPAPATTSTPSPAAAPGPSGSPAAPTPAPATTSTPPAAAPGPGTATGATPPSSSGTPPPSTSTTPPTTTPTTTGSTNPPPPPGSSATSLKVTGLFAAVLSVALALLY